MALATEWPALWGPPISDDAVFLGLPEIQRLDLAAIWDLDGPVTRTYANYTPIHPLLHALEVRLFGDWWPGFHGVNVVLHALASVLLFRLFARTGIAEPAALFGAALFLVHPANVEAVAWISQLKTTSAMVLALLALLLADRRPIAGAGAFALALLTKAHAIFALPVRACWIWTQGLGADHRAAWAGVAAWAVLASIHASLTFPVFLDVGQAPRTELTADRPLHARMIVATAGRYLAMALTGGGTSTLHEPAYPYAWTDPWWLGGAAALAVLAARLAVALRRRSPEAGYWIWAAAAFAPVSQIWPFQNQLADRYLFFILPGLLGGVLLAGQELGARARAIERNRAIRAVAIAAALALLLGWGLASHERARAWRHMDAYLVDAALHYPDGITAHVLRARGLARQGDGPGAARALRTARERGWGYVSLIFLDPPFARVRGDPAFQALVRELTQAMADRRAADPRLTSAELESLAELYLWRGEPEAARATLRRARERTGGGG